MTKSGKPDAPVSGPTVVTGAESLSAGHLAAIIASSFDAIVSKDLRGIVQTWNPAAERIFGWTAEEMIGASIRRIIPETHQDEEDAIIARIRTGARVAKFETERLHKDGHLVPVAITVSPVRDGEGRIVGASKIAHDIADQLAVRHALADSEERLRTLADNIAQLAWMADPSGSIFWYNRRWYEFTGSTLAEMQGWGWGKVHDPEHLDRVVAHYRASMERGVVWEDTFPLRGADGTYRWFLSRARPVRGPDGAIKMWLGTNTDVTESRENEERIRLLMREVNHRAKNMLGVVQSLARVTSTPAERPFVEKLSERLAAMAANQDMLISRDWTGAPVDEVVRVHVRIAEDHASDRFDLAGPDGVMLAPNATETLGLAISELTSNAMRHGAWSEGSAGRVAVSWRIDHPAEGPRLHLEWRETGGPATAEPRETGFGTVLIRRNPAAALGAKVSLDFSPEGLVWTFDAPLERVAA